MPSDRISAVNLPFEPELVSEIFNCGKEFHFKQNDIVIDIGQPVCYMPLLLSGALKILREDDNGEELLLYFLEKGDTCAMSMSCCLGQQISKIRATAETDGSLLLIPVDKMEAWMAKYPSWRNFIIESYHIRLNEMMDALDSLAFLNLEERLMRYLKEKTEVLNSLEINSTHQEIATEMHTSRVVISRVLKALEKKGSLQLHRNKIQLKD